MFIRTIRRNKFMASNGRPILPSMLVAPISKMRDQDLNTIFTYLKTIPAIENRVPDYQRPSQPAVK